MDQKINLALVGVGGIGAFHLAAIENLERNGGLRLVAVVEPCADRFTELKQRLADRGVRWYLDFDEMLAQESALDAVSIAVPISLHYEMVLKAMKRGVYINLEKPPVPLIQQLEHLLEVEEKPVSVGFQMITSQPVQKLKGLIVSGRLGTVKHISAAACWPRSDSYYARPWAGHMTFNGEPVFDGPATNALAHLIHNIMFLASPQPDHFDVPTEVEGELYRARPTIESYDVACLRGRFSSGTSFSGAFTHATEKLLPFRLEVQGSEGWARISEDNPGIESSFGAIDCGRKETMEDLLGNIYSQWVEFIAGKRPRPSSRLGDARGYVLATNGMFRSSRGIRAIDSQWFGTYEREGDRGLDVEGLYAAVERAFQEARLFSELGLPWASAPERVALGDLKSIQL